MTKRSIVAVLIVAVVVILVVASYYAYLSYIDGNMQTNRLDCTSQQYIVYRVIFISSTSGNSTTFTSNTTETVSTRYVTTANSQASVGMIVSMSETFTGTLTGPLAIWNEAICTYAK